MAILKNVNVKNNGRKKLIESVAYVSDSQKVSITDNMDRDFIASTWINRVLNGKKHCKRCFLHFVVSMERCWGQNSSDRFQYINKLNMVLLDTRLYFMKQGFSAIGYSHCNTKHPHYHLLLETCNAFNGKQFSQSKRDLAEFKEFVSSRLQAHGLNEEILRYVEKVTEEEILEEDFEIIDNENFVWNNGTMEQNTMMDIPFVCFEMQRVEMAQIVSEVERSRGREMVQIVPEAERSRCSAREMVRLVSDEERAKGREMVQIVPEIERRNKGVSI